MSFPRFSVLIKRRGGVITLHKRQNDTEINRTMIEIFIKRRGGVITLHKRQNDTEINRTMIEIFICTCERTTRMQSTENQDILS